MENKIVFSLCIVFLLLASIFFEAMEVSAQQDSRRFEGSYRGSSNYASYQNRPGFETYYSSPAGEGLGPRLTTYWPILGDKETCDVRQDLILNVAPAGCQPAVVRSDLLAEQNVPVFCQIDALKVNPLIDIKQIRNVRFIGQYPPEVVGAGYHPTRAALRTRDILLGSPLVNNIGYVVVVLKKQPVEKELPEFVNVSFNAQIEYTSDNALGVGRAEFLLTPTALESDWKKEKFKQSFWSGRYFVRLERADPNFADVSIYYGDRKVSTTRVLRGKISDGITVPGMYCRAALQIAYDDFVAARDSAQIEVSSSLGTDNFEVYEGSKFLDDRCMVQSIKINEDGETGIVEGRCKGQKFSLKLQPRIPEELKIFVGKDGKIAEIKQEGDDKFSVELSPDEKLKIPEGKYFLDNQGRLFAIIGSQGEEKVLIESNGSFHIANTRDFSDEDKKSLFSIRRGLIEHKRRWLIDESYLIGSLSDREISAEAKQHFKEAIKFYEQVVDDYPQEREAPAEGSQKFGAVSLKRAIELSKIFGLEQTQARLIRKLLDTYPDEETSSQYVSALNKLYEIDGSLAGEVILFEENNYVIRLARFNKPKIKSSVNLVFGREQERFYDGDSKDFYSNGVHTGRITIEEVRPEQVLLEANCYGTSNGTRVLSSALKKRYSLKIDSESQEICGVSVKANDVDLQQAVKVRLLPNAQGTETLTNFSVKIGIEKRAIKLSPDKALEKIENLNKSIADWQKISDQLKKFITGMKTACFATAGVLTVKNFFTGLSGESIARQEVMRGTNGWKEKCSKFVAEGKFRTLDACYLANSGEIDRQVGAMTKAIQDANTKIKEIQNKHKSSNGLFGESIDTDALKKDLAKRAAADYSDVVIDVSTLKQKWVNANGDNLDTITMKDLLADEKVLSTEDIRTAMLYAELKKRGGNDAQANARLREVAERVNGQRNIQRDIAQGQRLRNSGLPSTLYSASELTPTEIIPASSSVKSNYNLSDREITHVATYYDTSKGEKYVLGLKEVDASKGYYSTIAARQIASSGELLTNKSFMQGDELSNFLKDNKVGTLRSIDRIKYNNKISDADKIVKYFDTAPYRGMPAIVPFDTNQGWYAAARQVLPGGFGGMLSGGTGIGAYDASGKVSSFWICNVGENGRIEFERGFGDDLCQQVNLNTGQTLGAFPGKTDGEARALVARALECVEDAARQYGNQYVDVCGERLKAEVAVNQPQTQCQDFMSPKECLLMFNVCDPVICPASRCNLGGTFPVANVPQTGIVGSALLCLPNIREGIVIPVCLTGIQAGIDGWISIMKNYRDCLQENVNTGRTVGICDEIHSIYLCEFFWGQVAPFVNILVPKIIELAYGHGTRGGGEYLTVNAAWRNMENSINYFTQSYAVNSLKAFQARSTGTYGAAGSIFSGGGLAEVGTQFCKSFVSVKAPTKFKSLVEPDSPPQFQAWFDARRFSDATIPATSQYKVFYHIFAGNDAGIQYSVYLKSPQESAYYGVAPRVQVASGFIPRGEYKSETRDFTAPEGYQELCVRINNEEECGFKQVSTSFAVNFVRDQFVANELERSGITSERTCVSGGTSVGALLQPNLQSGVEEAVFPEAYNRGIVRICSTANPGISTDPTRFVDVGYCDDKKVRCWLDKQSVDRSLTQNNLLTRNETLQELEALVKDDLARQYALTESEAGVELGGLKEAINSLNKTDVEQIKAEYLNILKRIDFISDSVVFNYQKAHLLFLKARVHDIVAVKLLEIENSKKENSKSEGGSESVAADGEGSTIDSNSDKGGGKLTDENFVVSLAPSEKDDKINLLFNERSSDYYLAKNYKDVLFKTNNGIFVKIAEVNENGQITIIDSGDEIINAGAYYLQGVNILGWKDLSVIAETGAILDRGKETGFNLMPNGSIVAECSSENFEEECSEESGVVVIGEVNKCSGEIKLNETWKAKTEAIDGKEIRNLEQVVDVSNAKCDSDKVARENISKPAERQKWDLDSALDEVGRRIGKYSENKEFIDELYRDGIINQKEYDEINGAGLLNFEKDMAYVFSLLVDKIPVGETDCRINNVRWESIEGAEINFAYGWDNIHMSNGDRARLVANTSGENCVGKEIIFSIFENSKKSRAYQNVVSVVDQNGLAIVEWKPKWFDNTFLLFITRDPVYFFKARINVKVPDDKYGSLFVTSPNLVVLRGSSRNYANFLFSEKKDNFVHINGEKTGLLILGGNDGKVVAYAYKLNGARVLVGTVRDNLIDIIINEDKASEFSSIIWESMQFLNGKKFDELKVEGKLFIDCNSDYSKYPNVCNVYSRKR